MQDCDLTQRDGTACQHTTPTAALVEKLPTVTANTNELLYISWLLTTVKRSWICRMQSSAVWYTAANISGNKTVLMFGARQKEVGGRNCLRNVGT